MRRGAWIALFVVLAIAACGPPEVSEINGGSTIDDGDDDDQTATPTGSVVPTPTTVPSGAPTVTNVPSFATWQSQIRPLLCMQCHQGAAGGFVFNNDATQNKFYWFQSICNRDNGALNEGLQSYSPPTGRFRNYMIGQEPVGHTAINNNQAVVDAWLAEGAGTTPPNCLDLYDYNNSQ